MKIRCRGIGILSIFYFLFSTFSVSAAGLYFGSEAETFPLNTTFQVGVFFDTTGESVNAIEGTITYPSDVLQLVEIRDGGSTVAFWIERPSMKNALVSGKIEFSGVIPGGFSGKNGHLFTLIFTGKKTQAVALNAQDVQILKNDGTGTVLDSRVAPLKFEIIEPDSRVEATTTENLLRPYDGEIPENFTLTVTRDESVYDGLWFVVFATQDKGSGIDRYEVAEIPEYKSPEEIAADGSIMWTLAQSPYVLKDQSRKDYVYVRAIDRDGNVRVAMAFPEESSSVITYSLGFYVIIIAAILIGSLYFIVRKKRLK